MHRIGLYLFVGSYTAAAVVLILFQVSWEYQVGVAVVVIAVGIAGSHVPHLRKNLTLLVVGCVLAAARVAALEGSVPASLTPLFDHKVTVLGTIRTLPDIRETSAHITLTIREGSETTRIIAAVPLYPMPYVGDVVEVTGTIKHPESFETDGGREFAYADFLKKDGVYGLMNPAKLAHISQRNTPWLLFLRGLQHVKDSFMQSLELAIPDPESALAAGIIVGGKQGLGETLINAFERSGMLQIVVLSGYNVMIVASMIMQGLSRFPKRIAIALASTSIVSFVLIAGAGSSALRAGVMACFAIYARGTKRRYDVLRVLAMTLFILGFFNPRSLVYDPGFQFSCIATLGLILGVPPLQARLLWMRNAFLVEAFSTTLAAELFLLPFLLWQTGNLSVVSVFANIAAMPVIPFCMAASALAAMVAVPLSVLSGLLPSLAGLPAYLGLSYVLKVATFSSALPFASYVIPTFSFSIVVVSYCVLGLGVFLDSKRRSRVCASGVYP